MPRAPFFYLLVLPLALGGCLSPAGPKTLKGLVETVPPAGQAAPASVTVPLLLEANRALVELDFIRPDGSRRKALAFINMGSPGPVLTPELYKDLQIDQGRPLNFQIGDLSVRVAPAGVATEDTLDPNFFALFFAPRKVEAVLPSGVLQNYQLVLDYAHQSMTLAQPGSLKPEGVAVPLRVNEDSGLSAVDITVDGETRSVAIDSGGSYNWFRGTVVDDWVERHPDWLHAQGAVGLANGGMVDYAFEKEGKVVRIPEVELGALTLRDVGVLGNGPLLGTVPDWLFGNLFWTVWEKRTPGTVVGWIGGNVLKDFRVLFDYPNRMSYWQRQGEGDPAELNQVGITLVRSLSGYSVGGIVRKNGVATVSGVEVGDRLVRIGDLDVAKAGRGAVLAALHGAADERRTLLLDRAGQRISVEVPVTAF